MACEEKCCIMKTAPLFSTIRINTINVSPDEAKKRLLTLLKKQYETRGYDGNTLEIIIHDKLNDLLIIKALGPFSIKPVHKEIYVDEACASAVLRGADIFACGILASNSKFSIGDKMSIYVDLSGKCLRGTLTTLPVDAKHFLGNGISLISRQDVFSVDHKQLKGVGISMVDVVYVHPKFAELEIDSWAFHQNLPSVLCGHVLNPQPGDLVLDLCAAPGGKSTHLATLMGDQGKVVCIDVSRNRGKLITQKADVQGLKCIRVFCADGTNLASPARKSKHRATNTFPDELFDKILVDAPCSCLGARPFFRKIDSAHLVSYCGVQKRLLNTACKLLKKGGVLVYSTCTLLHTENEENVEYVLKTFPNMELESQEPFVLSETTLQENEISKPLFQKFDPRQFCELHNSFECLNDVKSCSLDCAVLTIPESCRYNFDTVGFFIAKFRKRVD